jgi:hypothetical protein
MIINELRTSNKYLLFVFLCLTLFLINYLSANLILNDEIYFSYFAEQLSYNQIQSYLDKQLKYQWISYLVIPLIYLIKFVIVSLILLTGAIFYNIEISFKKLFQIALIAEFLFVIPSLIKLFWFLFIQTDFDLIDLQTFYPLSLLNLIDAESIPQWSLYPLQLLNVFEVFYWFILAYGLTLATQEKWQKMLGLVASSYGVGLFVWVVFITFITINLS